MAGFREFVTGEVLTAANVDDFLAKQAVMKFADAAARNTALGTAVGGSNALREGMVAYLDDTNTPQYYDGSSWTDFSPSSLDASVITSGVFDAARIPDVANAGIGSNVVQTVKTNAFTTTSTSLVSVTGLSLTITPSSATSKILLIADCRGGNSSGAAGGERTVIEFFGGNSDDYATTYAMSAFGSSEEFDSRTQIQTATGVYLDSPATASAVTYEIKMRVTGGTGYLNRSSSSAAITGVSSLTAIEVAA